MPPLTRARQPRGTWRFATARMLRAAAASARRTSSGTRAALQVVLRAKCYGAAEVSWTIEHIDRSSPAYTAALKRRRSGLVDRLAEADAGLETARE